MSTVFASALPCIGLNTVVPQDSRQPHLPLSLHKTGMIISSCQQHTYIDTSRYQGATCSLLPAVFIMAMENTGTVHFSCRQHTHHDTARRKCFSNSIANNGNIVYTLTSETSGVNKFFYLRRTIPDNRSASKSLDGNAHTMTSSLFNNAPTQALSPCWAKPSGRRRMHPNNLSPQQRICPNNEEARLRDFSHHLHSHNLVFP